MRSLRSSLLQVIALPSEPSAASSIGPIEPAPPAPSTTAPAPSPNRCAVLGSSKSVIRVSASAPITSTRSARPVSICPAAMRKAARNPLHAAPMSSAPARSAPRAWATSGAAFGVISSGVIVATRTRSRSYGSTPASASARRAAQVAMSLRRSLGAARRRVWTPVRLTIQASSTPRRSESTALGTTSAGTQWPRPMTLAVRGGASGAPSRVASRATSRRSGGSVALRMGGLQLGRLHLAVGQDPLAHAGEHLARADLDEAADALGVERQHGLPPADGLGQRGGELLADVAEGAGGRARDDGEARLADLDVVQGGPERRDGGRHGRRVEG